LNSIPPADEARLISEARAAVLDQTRKGEFDPLPYEHATLLLESLPPTQFVDARVQLALDITVATRADYRPDLSRRALYAAFPTGCELKDKYVERKWLTFVSIIEVTFGDVERSLKYKLSALKLSEQLKDLQGLASEWSGLALSASGAGLHEDAVRYATIALEFNPGSDLPSLNGRSIVLLNRANALKRLARYAEAESDIAASLMTITYPTDASVREQMIRAQFMFAELRLERGDPSAARMALDAASTWAHACGLLKYKLQVEQVRARLSGFEFGIGHAASRLQDLLEQAYALEAEFGGRAYDDVVVDVLHTLERTHREHGDFDGANTWLSVIGERMRANAVRMLDALVNKPLIAESSAAVKMAEVDRYIESKATAQLGSPGTTVPSWTYLVGLAAGASAVEDPSKEHGVRVARLAGLVARELGLSDTLQRGVEAGCLVHDLGKVSVPSSILVKRTSLSKAEQRLYDNHPAIGAELLERVKLPAQGVVRNLIRFHHHAYNGGTTHSEVSGEAIPLESRIASVCDEYDSLVTGRPRRPPVSISEALGEIFEQRGGKFDPQVVDIFVEIVRDLQRSQVDLQAYLSEDAENMEYFAMQRTLKRAAERALTTK
jgi:HD-GYP domain-containing protein (c-di-GMP phosphodiesterase class II)